MHRRDFLIRIPVACSALAMAGCSSGPTVTESDRARRRRVIDTNFYATLTRLYAIAPATRQLVSDARGVLIFPTVVALDIGVPEQVGEGVLRIATSMDRYFVARSLPLQ